jgi:putative transposase
MGIRTIVLKLHKPSKAKQEIINKALLNYNKAFEFLIKEGNSNLSQLEQKFKGRSGHYNIMALSKWIGSDLSCQLNRFDVQPFKDSLRLEFAFTMANYLRAGRTYPGAIIDNLIIYGEEKYRPIYFCRYDTKRGYCLLYDREKERYYAKLYLQNGANARAAGSQNPHRQGLIHVHKGKQMLERSKRKETYIIVPLSFGKWQEKILKEAAESPECFKAARLLVKNNEYYLAISIQSVDVVKIDTIAFMGVCRGLKSNLNYTVVNLDGEIISSGVINSAGKSQNTVGIPLNKMHEAANLVTDIAFSYKAQVIVQNLAQRGDGLSWTENGQDKYFPEYRRQDYNRLTRILDYKLQWRCLPAPVRVSPVGIYCTCWNCGNNSYRNRFNKDLLICASCGMTMDIDQLGSLNLAKKLIDYKSSKVKIKIAKTDNGIIFTNKILGLNCFISYNEDQKERLKNEIQKIIQNTKSEAKAIDHKAYASRVSLIRKLESAQNVMDLIEYI